MEETTTTYVVQLPVFEGPLDLLLHLIEQEELDITRVALAQVTDQYLVHLRRMQRRNLAGISSFLQVAVQLLWIKSQALLPRDPTMEEEEEDQVDLVQQLREYRRYKEVARQLGSWWDEGRRAFERLVAPPQPKLRPEELENATLRALLEALEQRLLEMDPQQAAQPLRVQRRVTLAQKAQRIHTLLHAQEHVSFHRLLDEAPTREEVVVTLWAVLELFKRGWITFRQENLFEPITICRRSESAEWDRGDEWWTQLEDID